MQKIIHGDCLEVLRRATPNSIDAIVTDPPYELGFMGKSWDSTGIANNVELWKECLRVLKPGGHLLAFSGTRTYHRMASAIEDAGFEVRDMIEWVYGCLSEDTEILTSNGWKMLYSIFEGDYVFACDYQNDMKLQLEPVKQKFIYDYDEDAYHIKDTGYYNSELMETDHIVSRNHNVLVLESWIRNNGFGNDLYYEKIQAEKLYEYIKKTNGKQTFRIPGINGDIPCTIEKIPYKGKVWCVEVESGAFVARRKGKIFITGNSGFPKSLNIGKKIDHLIGNESFKEKEIEFVRWFKKNSNKTAEEIDIIFGWKNRAFHFFAESDSNRHIPSLEQYKILKNELSLGDEYDDFVKKHSLLLEEIRDVQGYEKSIKNWDKKYDKAILNKPKTELASEWEGWGTALKPAHEPICMARKPIEGTVAENCLKYGTGGINIEISRVTSNSPVLQNNQDYENVCNEFSYIQQSFLSSLSDTFFLSHELSQGYLKHIFFVLSPYNNCDTITLHTEVILAHTFYKGLQDALCDYGLKVQNVNEYVQSAIKAPNFQDDYPTLFSFCDALFHKKTIPFKDIVALSNDVQIYISDFINSGENITLSCSNPLNTFFVVFPYIMMLINKAPTLYLFHQQKQENIGRFPSNLIHDNSEEVRECFPETKSGGGNKSNRNSKSGFGGGAEYDDIRECDSGNASRFFKSIIYTAKASKAERNKGLDSIVLVDILRVWNEKNTTKEEKLIRLMVTGISPQKVIAESGVQLKNANEWNTCLFGKHLMEKYQEDIKSITKTETNSITTSQTLNWLTHLLTNEYTVGANLEMENGGNLVANAGNSNTLIITINEAMELALGVKDVVLGTQLKISVKEGSNIHSTVKPVALMEYLINMVTREGQIVLDPFAGSGTTLLACKNLGRGYVGIEREEEYIKIINARLGNIL